MRVERVRPTVVRLTLHAYEAAALMAAARWAAEGAQDPLPEEAAEQLRQILDSYDRALEEIRLNSAPRGDDSPGHVRARDVGSM
jgi:hypothetical protein